MKQNVVTTQFQYIHMGGYSIEQSLLWSVHVHVGVNLLTFLWTLIIIDIFPYVMKQNGKLMWVKCTH